jgi:hypothetical protein
MDAPFQASLRWAREQDASCWIVAVMAPVGVNPWCWWGEQVLTVGRTLFCANAGDSMAVLCRSDPAAGRGAALALSRMHKASDPHEARRIRAAGGRVRPPPAPPPPRRTCAKRAAPRAAPAPPPRLRLPQSKGLGHPPPPVATVAWRPPPHPHPAAQPPPRGSPPRPAPPHPATVSQEPATASESSPARPSQAPP